jgi:hypothetical protein
MNVLDVLTRRLAKVEARRPVDEAYRQLLRECIEGEKQWLELQALCAEFSPQLEIVAEALAKKTAPGSAKLLKALEETRRAIAKIKDCP